MKTAKEILKMSKEELLEYQWSDSLYQKNNIDNDYSYHFNSNVKCIYCSNCSYCISCIGCVNCSYSLYCRNASNLKYAICNVEVGKEKYEKKLKELGLTP